MRSQSSSIQLTKRIQELSARVGIPRALLENEGPSSPKVSDYLVGPQLDDAIAAGHDLSISWPFMEAQITDWTQAEAIWYAFQHATGSTIHKTLGNTYYSRPSAFDAPKWSHQSYSLYSRATLVQPVNQSARCSSSGSTSLDSQS
jgi:hypothetical protein